mmetsp:Transcript_24255/g.21371  ORF Transcript_24255/g.21371 Transcript_24255/m.21371 type:complete len:205 (+) Transcript_24255:941-1555(+)
MSTPDIKDISGIVLFLSPSKLPCSLFTTLSCWVISRSSSLLFKNKFLLSLRLPSPSIKKSSPLSERLLSISITNSILDILLVSSQVFYWLNNPNSQKLISSSSCGFTNLKESTVIVSSKLNISLTSRPRSLILSERTLPDLTSTNTSLETTPNPLFSVISPKVLTTKEAMTKCPMTSLNPILLKPLRNTTKSMPSWIWLCSRML